MFLMLLMFSVFQHGVLALFFSPSVPQPFHHLNFSDPGAAPRRIAETFSEDAKTGA